MKITQSRAQKHICLSPWSKPEIKSPIFQAEFIVEIASFKSLRKKKKKSRKKKNQEDLYFGSEAFQKAVERNSQNFFFFMLVVVVEGGGGSFLKNLQQVEE